MTSPTPNGGMRVEESSYPPKDNELTLQSRQLLMRLRVERKKREREEGRKRRKRLLEFMRKAQGNMIRTTI